jgi:hypothetical protein
MDSDRWDIGQSKRSISFHRLITYNNSVRFPPNHFGAVLRHLDISGYKTSDQSWPQPKVSKQSK